MRSTPIRILIVDDHPVVLAGLSSMLGTQSGMEVAGSACGGEEALEMLRLKPADLLLLDLRMPGVNGIDTLHALKRAKINIRVIQRLQLRWGGMPCVICNPCDKEHPPRLPTGHKTIFDKDGYRN